MEIGLIQFPQDGQMCWDFLNTAINSWVGFHKMETRFYVTHTARTLVEIRGKSGQVKQRLAFW